MPSNHRSGDRTVDVASGPVNYQHRAAALRARSVKRAGRTYAIVTRAICALTVVELTRKNQYLLEFLVAVSAKLAAAIYTPQLGTGAGRGIAEQRLHREAGFTGWLPTDCVSIE